MALAEQSKKERESQKRGKQNFTRKGAVKEKKKRILILTEGEKTEPFYLNGLCKYLWLNTIKFNKNSDGGVCIEGEKVDSAPISIAKFAKKEASKEEGTGTKKEAYWDIIYCVFDRDTHPTFHKAINAIHTLQKNHPRQVIKAIVSDICFELWFLLHFSYPTHKFLRADDLIHHLKYIKDENGEKPFKNYSKNNNYYFEITLPYINNALINAEQLRQEYEKTHAGAYTDIDILINELKTHLPPARLARGNVF